MKRLIVFLLVAVASMALCSCSDNNTKPSGGGSSAVMAEAEQEDFVNYLRQHANCGELFRTIMESFETTYDLFDDCIGNEDIFLTMSFADLRDQLSSTDILGDGGFDAY